VSAANVADVKAAPVLLVPALEMNTRLVKVLADQAYRGPLAQGVQQAYTCMLELTENWDKGLWLNRGGGLLSALSLGWEMRAAYVEIIRSCPFMSDTVRNTMRASSISL